MLPITHGPLLICLVSVCLPSPLPSLLLSPPVNKIIVEPRKTRIEVWETTTLQGILKLVAEGANKIAVLNFASARNPGGGFLSGAQAQEESLVRYLFSLLLLSLSLSLSFVSHTYTNCRASGLYACLTSPHCAPMYKFNNDNRSCLYSHYMIYSPDVPVFKEDNGDLLDNWIPVSFISSPAVNAGVVRKRDRNADQVRALLIAIEFNSYFRLQAIEGTMKERLRRILLIAKEHGHDTILLGAFGCGVFENRPPDVARWFAELLLDNGAEFENAFLNVIFAILDNKGGRITSSFVEVFFGQEE